MLRRLENDYFVKEFSKIICSRNPAGTFASSVKRNSSGSKSLT